VDLQAGECTVTFTDITPYRNARQKAQDRARELTAYVKENTRHIDWPEGLSPDDMQEQIERVFYESEKAALPGEKIAPVVGPGLLGFTMMVVFAIS
jgi:hypothetical protein